MPQPTFAHDFKKLFIASVTVRNHVQNILHTLDVHSRLEAVVLAHEHHLI